MKYLVQILSVELMDQYEGTVRFEINGNEYDAFFFGQEYEQGQNIEVELSHFDLPLKWDVIFNENKGKEIRLEKSTSSDWSYHGYGKIQSINPIIADFGDFRLELGNWTNDVKVIGEYIFWNIWRLEISK